MLAALDFLHAFLQFRMPLKRCLRDISVSIIPQNRRRIGSGAADKSEGIIPFIKPAAMARIKKERRVSIGAHKLLAGLQILAHQARRLLDRRRDIIAEIALLPVPGRADKNMVSRHEINARKPRQQQFSGDLLLPEGANSDADKDRSEEHTSELQSRPH